MKLKICISLLLLTFSAISSVAQISAVDESGRIRSFTLMSELFDDSEPIEAEGFAKLNDGRNGHMDCQFASRTNEVYPSNNYSLYILNETTGARTLSIMWQGHSMAVWAQTAIKDGELIVPVTTSDYGVGNLVNQPRPSMGRTDETEKGNHVFRLTEEGQIIFATIPEGTDQANRIAICK